jgi:hypothetical protein
MSLIRDTLKNPKTGQWSRKNLTSVTSLFYAMAYPAYGMIFDKTVHEFVVIGFLTLAGGMLGVSSWEKKNLSKGNGEGEMSQS